MNGGAVWDAFVPNYGNQVVMALHLVRQIPVDILLEGARRIDTETAIGPLINPSAYTDGARFDNAREYIRVLKAMAELRRAIPDVQGGQ